MTFKTLEDTGDIRGKRALVRVDFNVPMDPDGKITDDTRLRAALPTIRELSLAGARIALLAHFGRPKGKPDADMSLKSLAEPLSNLLEQPVAFAADCIGPDAAAVVDGLEPGGVALLENVRFRAGEEANDAAFADALAAIGDLYINDAFSAAHRAHASTEGLAHRLPAYAGLAMQAELEALDKALGKPERPVMGVVGGAKVSTKLELLENLVGRLDRLAIGGGMANTFLFAQGHDIGGSLAERDMADTARDILRKAEAKGCEILLPTDVVVATEVAPGAASRVCRLGDLAVDEKILDAGPESTLAVTAAMDFSKTLIWNGPLGVFEVPPFDKATVEAARHASSRVTLGELVAVAGGGDTVAALNHAGVAAGFTFVSTAGGAFLEWMEGKTLPGVAALEG